MWFSVLPVLGPHTCFFRFIPHSSEFSGYYLIFRELLSTHDFTIHFIKLNCMHGFRERERGCKIGKALQIYFINPLFFSTHANVLNIFFMVPSAYIAQIADQWRSDHTPSQDISFHRFPSSQQTSHLSYLYLSCWNKCFL